MTLTARRILPYLISLLAAAAATPAAARAQRGVLPAVADSPTATEPPSATVEASDTPTPTESGTATFSPTVTATPSATFTGTPPTPTPPPRPNIGFLFAASGGLPLNEWECSFNFAVALGLSGAEKTFTDIAGSDAGSLRNIYQVIYVAPGLNGGDYAILQQLVAPGGVIEQFVASGGVAVINAAGSLGDQQNIAPDGVGFSALAVHDGEDIPADTHPYITGAGFGGALLSSDNFSNWQHTDLGFLTNLPVDVTTVLTNTDGPSWAEYRHGNGRVIVTTLTYCTDSEPQSQQAAMANLLRYSRFFSGSAFTPAPTLPPPTSTSPPTRTPFPSVTRTATPTATATRTRTPTVTSTPPNSPTSSPTPLPTNTAVGTATDTPTPPATDTPTLIPLTETPTTTPCETISPCPRSPTMPPLTETPTATPTTPTPTSTPAPTDTATASATPTATVTATPACAGDCNGDGQVTVDELLTMVNIALGNEGVASCLAGDANADGHITVDEILLAVGDALDGCPIPTVTPTPQQVLHFLHFDTTGIVQADSARQSSADVDVVQGLCVSASGPTTVEPFSQTVINAVFRNDGPTDLELQSVSIDLGPSSGIAVIQRKLGGVIPGGRCAGNNQQCVADGDCGQSAPCVYQDTVIGGILLFDFDTKVHVVPGTYDVSITFAASDGVHVFQTDTGYSVRFDDFCNCPPGTSCGG